ncbi:esterase B1-like isoform X1 [Aricia agestis]|uniref:esterase B1-like isoform X1 n=1 Tax=Aricia agestis TaxID=91739 RepID=UPI001C207076|nr:esterase B1-like isoform X1 [Aricia agestis]
MVKVHVEQGWLEGEELPLVTADGRYYSFKGIPYAKPPLGELRFTAPAPPSSWEGVRKATSHGKVCPQYDIFSGSLMDGSEDCLYLNVYTPNVAPKTPLPVMVFIHGGGYKSGSGNDDYYGPDFLVKENVVLVTINYRLEALGFLCLDISEAPGNAGMKDQVAALRWVQKNIASFGGDPSTVTIFGESAGGASTGYHVLSPMSKNLFKRAILMSGVPICDWSLNYNPQRRAITLAKQLGCESEDPHEVLKFLQSVPVDKLVHTNPCITKSEVILNNPFKMYHFTPVVEKNLGQEAFLLEEPLKLLMRKDINEVDAMLGYTNEEALVGLTVLKEKMGEDYEKYPDMFVPKRILYKKPLTTIMPIAEMIIQHYFGKKTFHRKENMRNFIKYATDMTFIHFVHKFIDLMSRTQKGKYYLYNISVFSERNVFGNHKETIGMTGTAHLDDLLYLFNPKLLNLPINKEGKSYKMIRQTCALFANFAKYGNPTPDSSLGVTWLPYDENSKKQLDIGEELVLNDHVNLDTVKFWDHIYEIAGVSCFEYV